MREFARVKTLTDYSTKNDKNDMIDGECQVMLHSLHTTHLGKFNGSMQSTSSMSKEKTFIANFTST